MSLSLQVLYPANNGTTFDYEYYLSKHIPLVGEHVGTHLENTVIAKGLAGGPEAPAGFHAVATLLFADKGEMDAAMAAIGPAVADIPNFYSGDPQMLVGEIIG